MAHLSIATTTAANDPSQWQYLEACLFAFKEIAESVDVKESCYLPMFMAHLRNVPLQHIRIISATMEAIGAYAEWINVHPNVLGYVVPLLLMGLQNAEIAVSATFALKDITSCYSAMQPFAEEILHACLEALKGNVLKSREKVRVMCAVGKVLSIMPYSYIMNYLNSLLSPVFDQLQQHLCSEMNNPTSAAAIVRNLHMLTMLFSNLDTHWDKGEETEEKESVESNRISEENQKQPQPVLFVLEKLLAIFSSLGNKWEANEQITEAVCDALKKSLSVLSDDCKIFLSEMLNLMMHLYKHCPHSSVLDMTKQLLLLFSNVDDQTETLSKYFAEICNHTIQLSMNDFRESTGVIESFLQMLEQIIKRSIVFLKSDNIDPLVLFQFALAALNLPEKPTVKAAAGFLTNFVIHSREVPKMLNVVNSQGETMVMQVLKVIGGDTPRSVVEYMPDILMALNKKYFDNLCRWMVPFTQQEGFPSYRVSQQQKEEFTRMVLK
ncbi:Importin-13, partial [Stegodyphus mimosarum]